MPVSDAELRQLVRSLVVAALERKRGEEPAVQATSAATPPAKLLLALFTGSAPLADDFLPQLAFLAAQGFSFGAAFSHTFSATHDVEAVTASLPALVLRLDPSSPETELLKTAGAAVGLITPTLSGNSSAKVVQGIEDSLPSLMLRRLLLAGRPVFVAQDLPLLERSFTEAHPGATPPLLRSVVDPLHRLQLFGVRFVSPDRMAAEVAALFTVSVNETPARLAKTRSSPKRVFITAEDVSSAASEGRKELVHPADAVVTDAAREAAVARGVALREG